MAERSRFESIKAGSTLLEKETFSEKVEQRAVIKFCVNIGKTPTETHKFLKLSEKHSKVSRSLVFKWHKRFSDGRDSLQDDMREGRPSFRECHAIKNEVRDVIESDRRLTVREIAEKCAISKTTVHDILSQDLNMSRVCARWVPRILTNENLERRVESSKQFIKKFNLGGARFLDRIITTDESWFHYYDPETKQQSSQWKYSDSPPPKKAKVTKSLGKNMFILFMDRKGIILTHAVPKGQTVNSDYYCKVLRRDLVQALRKKRPYLAANLDQVILHQDNAPAHTSQKTQLEIDLLGFECLKHPPYSPDLAPMDFAVFPFIKSFLRGQRFDDLQDLRQEVLNIIFRMKPEQFVHIFDDWLKRHRKCVDLKGDYVEKS